MIPQSRSTPSRRVPLLLAGFSAAAIAASLLVVVDFKSRPGSPPASKASNAPASSAPAAASLSATAASDFSEAVLSSVPASVPGADPAASTPFRIALRDRTFDEPAAAARFAASLPADGDRDAALSSVAREWARTDLASAAAWVRSVTDMRLRNDLLRQIGVEAVRISPARALELAGDLPSGDDQASYLQEVTHAWAATAPSEAARWARGIPDSAIRGNVQSAVAIEWAQNEPAAAADYIASQMSAGESQNSSAITVARRWAHLDFPAAKAWAEQFPDGPLRNDVMRAVMSERGVR